MHGIIIQWSWDLVNVDKIRRPGFFLKVGTSIALIPVSWMAVSDKYDVSDKNGRGDLTKPYQS